MNKWKLKNKIRTNVKPLHKDNQNKQKGVTLIALIITVIVMLILLLVTIRLAIDSGLFGYAQNSVKKWVDAGKKEQEVVNIASDTIDAITNEEIDFPVTSSIYAKFYEDGTFILSSSNYIDASKGNYKDYGDIAADKYGEDNLPEWLNDPIIEVLVYDKIQPVNTSNWFRRTERKDRHNKNNRFKKFRYK